MSTHNFVIVGAGSAGSVLAARLSEDPSVQVLVLEAGGADIPAEVSNPALWPNLLGSSIDWRYSTMPQPGLNGRTTQEPRGKVPGGSSNLYIMMHIRGHPSDYDHWAYQGCPGWSYQQVLPYFQKLEHQEDDTSPWAGKEGPLYVANAKLHHPNPTSATFIDACGELGYPITEDFNGPNMEGAGWHHVNIKDGQRHSTAVAYLFPALQRPNLTLYTNAQATRLLFDGKRCVGVEYSQHGEIKTANATREVIVCAGAIESPKLLLLSGIGNPSQLKEFGIPLVAEVPGVGENFHNHVLTGVISETARPVPPPHENLSESALFCKSDPGWVGPDLQLGFVHVSFNIIIGQSHPNAVSILPGVVRPLSRGWIRLASKNPLDKPLVNPNYLSADADLERLVQGVKIARQIFATRAFSSWIRQELQPGVDVRSDEQLRTFVRASADSYHHQVGSCKMGLDDMAVVDPQLRVHSITGLRIADASVMPVVPSGNCHTGILMIAEKAADLIKQAYSLHGTTQYRSPSGGGHFATPYREREANMSIQGKKIAILLESDFAEEEIFYYQHRFLEENVDLHFMTRLWGQPSLTFYGHENHAPFVCHESFENMDDATLDSFAAIIVPGGFVSDRLRYSEDINRLAPATEFLKRAFARKYILKGINCHGMWLVSRAPELVRGRRVVAHTNLIGDVSNMGATYVDEDVVVDDDLVTGRSAPLCHFFAHTIIHMLSER